MMVISAAALPSAEIKSTRDHAIIQTPRGPMRVMEASVAYGIDYMTLFGRLKARWPTSELLKPSTIDRKRGAPTISGTQAYSMQRFEKAAIEALVGRFQNYTFREAGLPMQEARDIVKDIEDRLISEDSSPTITEDNA